MPVADELAVERTVSYVPRLHWVARLLNISSVVDCTLCLVFIWHPAALLKPQSSGAFKRVSVVVCTSASATAARRADRSTYFIVMHLRTVYLFCTAEALYTL
jgi:hypothetical protein